MVILSRIRKLLRKLDKFYYKYLMTKCIAGLLSLFYPFILSYLIVNILDLEMIILIEGVIAIVAVRILSLVLEASSKKTGIIVSSNIVVSYQNKIEKDILEGPSDVIDNKLNGELVSKYTKDIDQIASLYVEDIPLLIQQMITIILIILYLFVVDYILVVFLCVAVPLIILFMRYFSIKLEAHNKELMKVFDKQHNLVLEMLYNFTDIIQFQAKGFFLQKSATVHKELLEKEVKVYNSERIIWVIELICYNVFGVFYFAGCSILAFYRKVNVESTINMMFLNINLIDSILSISSIFSSLLLHLESYQRIQELHKEIRNKVKQREMQSDIDDNVDYVLNNVSFQIKGCRILNDIDIRIPHGSKILIVGESGSGKSTLVKLMTGYSNQYEGSIKLRLQEIGNMGYETLNQYISYMTNTLPLFEGSIESNFEYFRNSTALTIDDIQKRYPAFGLWKEVNREQYMKDAYENELLSTGQLQRLLYIMLISQEKEIYVIDEGFSNLNDENIIECMDIMRQLSSTFVVVAHNVFPSSFSYFDEIYEMKEGQLRLLRKGDVYGEC